MAHTSELIATDIDAYLLAHQHKSLLRFITCGSVDDGKSTLIGRLLYESHMVFEDHLAALEVDSKRSGTQGEELDLALLVDGLGAEREQGITIDVAYRFFSTETRKFIVADTPGHEQYTRNMATGASTADVAVILVDARHGVMTQTRRHSFIVHLLGIKKVLVAINKLDLVDFSQGVFERISADYRDFATGLGLRDITCVPMSALRGDNVVVRSANTPWYDGPTLMDYLETVEVEDDRVSSPFRLPVQWVNRPDLDFRGFAGTITGGSVRVGDAVTVLPSGARSTVARIVTFDGDREQAVAEESVTLTLTDEVDCSRGDVLSEVDRPGSVADRFTAHIVWMGEGDLNPGRAYQVKLGTQTVGARLSPPTELIDVNTMERRPADTLRLNEIGVCELRLDKPVAYDLYEQNRDAGGFVVIDRLTNGTVAAGMLIGGPETVRDVAWQATEVDKAARAVRNGHQPRVVWFTGLSGAGKSTVADIVERRLHALGVHTYLLDGDNLRHGLNGDLGFSDADRVENIRRVGEVSRLMVDAGLIVLVCLISPFRADRELARGLVAPGEFIEVHVATPLEVAEARDVKGLYARARRGEIPSFTGIDSPYEEPLAAEVVLDTTTRSAEESADVVIAHLRATGALG